MFRDFDENIFKVHKIKAYAKKRFVWQRWIYVNNNLFFPKPFQVYLIQQGPSESVMCEKYQHMRRDRHPECLLSEQAIKNLLGNLPAPLRRTRHPEKTRLAQVR